MVQEAEKGPVIPETISASRVPALLGMDSRCSPLTLFLRLSGQLGEQYLDGDVAIQQGRYYERATADWCCDVYGMKIVPGFEQLNMRAGVLSGHPDFAVIDEHGKLAILEVKNPFWSYKGDDWGEAGTDQVPKAYYVQTLVYQELLRAWWKDQVKLEEVFAMTLGADDPVPELADYGYVCAKLSGGIDRFKIAYDKDIIANVQKEVEMMLTRVQIDDPPAPEDEQDMRNRWPVVEGKVSECNEAFMEQLKLLIRVKKQIKELEEQKSALQTIVLGHAQDAEKLEFVDTDGNRTLVATLGVNRKFDAEACVEAHPDLPRDYFKLDAAKLRKEQKALHEMFSKKPEKATEQTRVIRLKEKAING